MFQATWSKEKMTLAGELKMGDSPGTIEYQRVRRRDRGLRMAGLKQSPTPSKTKDTQRNSSCDRPADRSNDNLLVLSRKPAKSA
jgi:hypothetical protein